MQTATTYRYNLDKTSRKYNCPQCGQKRFTRTVDNEAGGYLPDHVGRCDRESSCGYDYTWSQYLKDSGTGQESKPFISAAPVEEAKPVEYLPLDLLGKSLKFYPQNNLFQFLKGIFTEHVALDLFKRYLIGTSSYWKGATIFWQVDHEERVRQAKIILYNPETGKRVKAGAEVERMDKATRSFVKEIAETACSKIQGKYLPGVNKDINLEQCFFGQHLLAEHPDKPVCIVESEKTSLIASIYMPSVIWLATGGASGCKWREFATYKVLKGRSVTFFPDYGYFNKKAERTCYSEWCERANRISEALGTNTIRVSPLLENRLAGQDREDEDLADLLLMRDEQTGIALVEGGYPVIWDYHSRF